jgi:hypothetical protein
MDLDDAFNASLFESDDDDNVEERQPCTTKIEIETLCKSLKFDPKLEDNSVHFRVV